MNNMFFLEKNCLQGSCTKIYKTRMLTVIFTILFTFGCTHTPKSELAQTCSGISFHSPTEIHACIGDGEFNVGDRVVFLKNKCSTPTRGNPKKCYKVKVGEGSVTKILDEHVATIKPDSQFEMTRTTIVEKMNSYKP